MKEIVDWKGAPWPLKDVLSEVGEGWTPLLLRLVDDLFTLGWDGQLLQVKEKFGGLRFYIDGGSETIHERIGQAENESHGTCEKCGAPGGIGPGYYWLKTLCEFCEEKRRADSNGSLKAPTETQ
jgi:hypothetical protein